MTVEAENEAQAREKIGETHDPHFGAAAATLVTTEDRAVAKKILRQYLKPN